MDVDLLRVKIVKRLNITYCSTSVIGWLLSSILVLELYWILPYFIFGSAELSLQINIVVYVIVLLLIKWFYPFIHIADDSNRKKQILEILDRGVIKIVLFLTGTQVVMTPFLEQIAWTPTIITVIQTGLWVTASALAWDTRPVSLVARKHEYIPETDY